ncbi:hypothetical protein GCM10010140_49560 [Streptosporangium pseudovulgare]|uniref:Uncharacterized protein n=1 Tax=Streptosporangium pseudovulgare TaxID=35765 RepID=A0ABQ2R896_9ACTN|nr:hypothetical protein GCM10010140_49560 [Streptosporangium pseudovulgare]
MRVRPAAGMGRKHDPHRARPYFRPVPRPPGGDPTARGSWPPRDEDSAEERRAATGGEPDPPRPTDRFARGERSVRTSYVISPKGLIVTLGMVLGDFPARASTRER